VAYVEKAESISVNALFNTSSYYFLNPANVVSVLLLSFTCFYIYVSISDLKFAKSVFKLDINASTSVFIINCISSLSLAIWVSKYVSIESSDASASAWRYEIIEFVLVDKIPDIYVWRPDNSESN